MKELIEMVEDINPERVYIGYNSKPERVQLPEPSLEKTCRLIESLEELGYTVKRKLLREAFE